MYKKVLIIIGGLVFTLAAFYIYFNRWADYNNSYEGLLTPITEFGSVFDELAGRKSSKFDSELEEKDIINILLLGIDRRSRAESSYRTDIMILLSINTRENIAVMTSVPRDLWYGGGRLNATYIGSGWPEIQNGFEKVTGLRPDRFILTDFEDFRWIVDAMGGVPVTVQTTFTDSSYPVDATKGYQTISFTAGNEVLTGSRALIYARSRKGNNGEGGDYSRMARQHLILKGMLEAVVQPKSLFQPMNVAKALDMVTSGRMDTNLELSDAKYLWDFHKDRDTYTIESILMDTDYVFSPPMEDYGGAWVLAPIGGTYLDFQEDVENALYGREEEVPIEDTPAL